MAEQHLAPTMSTGRRRADLDGLRGVALTLVVAFHVLGNGRVSGGIDVFLAITGFLFTASLLRRVVEGGGRIDLSAHFGRIGQRLLPAALVVIAAIGAGTVLVLPMARWLQVADEMRASALYHENWQIIASQLSYDAAGPGTSPLQHFWSLSIQGQFHLIWPFIIMAAVWLARRLQVPPRTVVLWTVAAIFVVSLGFSVYLTATDQPVAYFHTGTRIWELALGGLAGLVLPTVHAPAHIRVPAGWLGLGLILSCGLVLDGARTFPGYLALWPVLGLILVLFGGQTDSRWGVHRVLTGTLQAFMAKISYALYLWHWPVLIFYLNVTGYDRAGPRGIIGVLGLSVALAWATTRFVEHPAMTISWERGSPRFLRATVAAMAIVGLTTASASTWLGSRQAEALDRLAHDTTKAPGAAALVFDTGPLDDEGTVPTQLEVLPADRPEIYGRGCVQNWRDLPENDEVLICHDDVADPSLRVVMSSGSHVLQWWPAFVTIAAEQNWELIVVDRDGCQLTADRDGTLGPRQNSSCYRWNDEAIEVIESLDPDLLITLGSTTRGEQESTPEGSVRIWDRLGRSGTRVLALRDTARLNEDPVDCFGREGLDPIECGRARSRIYAEASPLQDLPDNVTPLDMTDYFCTADYCPAIVGGVIVYRDSHHVTTTYMHTVTPFLELELREHIPWAFNPS